MSASLINVGVTAGLSFLAAVLGAGAVVIGHLLVLRQTKQLTLAEKRMAAHQEAFYTWWKLATSHHKPDQRQEALLVCQEFWNRNCLYLGRRTRKSYRDTMIDVICFDGSDSFEVRKELHRKIESVFDAIFADAALPELHESVTDIKALLTKQNTAEQNERAI